MIVINGLNPVAPIEDYVEELTDEGFPASAIVACLIRYDEAGPLLLALLVRAADDESAADIDANQFFRALHIIAGARDKRAFAPLLRLLRRRREVEWLLAEVLETLPCIAIGTFDGDCESLFEVILDKRVDEFDRAALVNAATYLTWEGRIERDRMIRFLEEFATGSDDMEDAAPRGAWAMSIGLLGLDDMKEQALRAWRKGLIPYDDQGEFLLVLAQAESAPDDGDRFDVQGLGHIDNVLETLQQLFEFDKIYDDVINEEADDIDLEPPAFGRQAPAPFELQPPVMNPMRKVGRNDPCPCGSGKKAKRCCLAT